MKLTEVCINKPVFAWMIMAATIVLGGVAASRIGVSLNPDVDYPGVSISMAWEGAPAEVMEHDVVYPIEQAMVQVEGVKGIYAQARQGSAQVYVELDLARPVDVALQEVQSRLARAVRQLPRDMEPPVVSKSNPEDSPIIWLNLSGPFAPQLLADTARYRIADVLQTVPGVGEIGLGGYLERNIRVWVDADRLAERGVTVQDVTAALQREHLEMPAGRLEAGHTELNIRVLGEALDLTALRRLVIRKIDKSATYLEDVASVEDGFEDQRHLSRVNGQPALGFGVRKQRGANALAVARGVHAAIDQIKPTLPEGMVLATSFDSTRFIEESVHEVEFEIGLAIVLTGLICWLFLGSLSSTLNVVLAIPMSLLGTVGVLYFCGFTLNTFTLLAMGLAVGIVVDDAIMVLENIVRHVEMGEDRQTAARTGTAEITTAAFSATLAVVAIFAPVIFMRGVIGKYFLQFGVALSVAVLLSYVEAITLAPARCAQFLQVNKDHQPSRIDAGFSRLADLYRTALGGVLRRPAWVVAVGVVVLGMAWAMMRALPVEFIPSQDQGELSVRLQTAVGASLQETNELVELAEAQVAGMPEVQRSFTMVGSGYSVNSGFMYLTLQPRHARTRSQSEVQSQLRRRLNDIPGLKAVVQDLSQSGFGGSGGFPINFSVRGPDWDTLVDISKRVRDQLAQSGMVVDLDSNYKMGAPELRLTPDRARAADVGVSVQDIAGTLNALVGGTRVGKYNVDGRRIDVRLRLLAAQRRHPDDLTRLHVRNRDGALVPLAGLVSQEERPTLQSINRANRERAISIYANVAPHHAQEQVLQTIRATTNHLPAGYHVVFEGSSATFNDSMGDLYFALALGVVVAYMILASQFNSFLHPITVLTVLPLSVAGAALALWATGKSLNIFTMIGLLLLLGIVKKNSIILVDYANQRRQKGDDARAAMQHAGPVRLRPILMTSMATMMAVVPAALSMGPGAETRGPMGIAVLGGLALATVMSLLVVPAFYVMADDVKQYLATRLAGRQAAPHKPYPV